MLKIHFRILCFSQSDGRPVFGFKSPDLNFLKETPSVLHKILQPVLHNVSAENTEGLTKKGHNFVIGLLQQSKKTGF